MLSPPEQVILFVHWAWAMSLHAFSIVGATAESASGPPSVDFDAVVPQPQNATSATAKNVLEAIRSRSNEVDDMARLIGLISSDLSRRARDVISGTKLRGRRHTYDADGASLWVVSKVRRRERDHRPARAGAEDRRRSHRAALARSSLVDRSCVSDVGRQIRRDAVRAQGLPLRNRICQPADSSRVSGPVNVTVASRNRRGALGPPDTCTCTGKDVPPTLPRQVMAPAGTQSSPMTLIAVANDPSCVILISSSGGA